MKKTFNIEVVLSAVTGKLLCSIGEVYEILNFLTGDNLFTHQLPRAGRVCRIPVFKEHPFLKDIDVSDINTDNWKEKLEAIKAKHPHEIELSPVPNWTHINPIDEAVDMMGGEDKVSVISI